MIRYFVICTMHYIIYEHILLLLNHPQADVVYLQLIPRKHYVGSSPQIKILCELNFNTLESSTFCKLGQK